MPIFEEKLICPLAIRFMQDLIRPVFQDGRDLESAITAIKTRPGIGEYDVIVEPTFPTIEIMRWHQRGTENKEPDARHWFTLDNRRLYCLQRVAASMWPRRVGVVVQVLYAAPEGTVRKSDSSVVGRSVHIGHSMNALESHWDWRKAVPGEGVESALQFVAIDDARPTLQDLTDAPAPPSMLDLYLKQAAACPDSGAAPQKPCDGNSEGSTRGPSTPRSADGSTDEVAAMLSATAARSQRVALLKESLSGTWKDEWGETYRIKVIAAEGSEEGASWSCASSGTGGKSTKATLWYDAETATVSWGPSWEYYASVPAMHDKPQQVLWYGGEDAAMKWPQFTLSRVKANERGGRRGGGQRRQGGAPAQ
mmetsp:Transcript_66781/g.186297  ORF Transcript_66781/g.186297 Transcript_66781/m.186297 type:complete len:365 (+) Transcript_66781:122-1216(+)